MGEHVLLFCLKYPKPPFFCHKFPTFSNLFPTFISLKLLLFSCFFRRSHLKAWGSNSYHFIFISLFSVGSDSKRKEFAHTGTNPFFGEYVYNPILKSVLSREGNKKSQFFSVVKLMKKLFGIPIHLKLLLKLRTLALKAPNKNCSRRHFNYFTFVFRKK